MNQPGSPSTVGNTDRYRGIPGQYVLAKYAVSTAGSPQMAHVS